MKTILYIRASTEQQSYDQQRRTINGWLHHAKITPDMEFLEKESGSKKHTERVLIEAINYCQPSDQIVVAEFSRLSRSMSDAANIIDLCVKKGINIVAIKENLHIKGSKPNDITTKLLVMVFGLSAEIELSNIKSRTQSGLNVIKDNIKKHGFAVGKRSGRTFEKLGNPNLSDMAMKGSDASAISRRKKKVNDQGFRQTYELARLLFDSGLKNEQIAERLNANGYRTPKGCNFLSATVSRLLIEGKKML